MPAETAKKMADIFRKEYLYAPRAFSFFHYSLLKNETCIEICETLDGNIHFQISTDFNKLRAFMTALIAENKMSSDRLLVATLYKMKECIRPEKSPERRPLYLNSPIHPKIEKELDAFFSTPR
ncbi:MAG: hypothetical protein Q7V63_01730 [Gammaproteobacteria bacterium]|nr:hypothetical protein [Gammaproteobacteria bacterium]